MTSNITEVAMVGSDIRIFMFNSAYLCKADEAVSDLQSGPLVRALAAALETEAARLGLTF